MNPLQAGGQLGQAVFGGKSSGDAYDQSFSQAAKAQGAMQEARRQRALALIAESRVDARSSLPAALGGVYTDPAQAALGQAVLLSNDSVNLGNLGKLEAPGSSAAYNQASSDMNSGDTVGYNQQAALATGRNYEPVRLTGGVATPSGVPLGDAAFHMEPLPQTQATIDERHAGAAKENAMAGAADALAQKRRAPSPNAAGGGSSGTAGTGKVYRPTNTEITATVGTTNDPDTGRERPDPEGTRKLLAWLAQHPGQSVGDYITHGPVGAPGTNPPAGANEPLSNGLGDSSVSTSSPSVRGPALKPSSPSKSRTITRTGTLNGRKVVQYSDGAVDYAD